MLNYFRSGGRTACIALGLGLSTMLGATAVQSAEVIWNFSDEYQQSSVTGEAAQFFARRVAELSDGRMEIILHHGGSLGYKSADNFDAVGDGLVEAANSFTGAWQGFDSIFMVSLQPFVATSIDEAKILYDVAKPGYDEVFAANNQKVLYTQAMPPSGIWGCQSACNRDPLSARKIDSLEAELARRCVVPM